MKLGRIVSDVTLKKGDVYRGRGERKVSTQVLVGYIVAKHGSESR